MFFGQSSIPGCGACAVCLPTMQTDRWIEMDLYFFQEKPFTIQAREAVGRMAPLWRNVDGDFGIIFCCAWLCDLVTEWQGKPGQCLPFRSPSAKNWSRWTYADLQELFRVLKEEGEKAGLPRFKVGLTMVAWGTFDWGEGGGYDFQSGWYERHPEIYFTDHWKNLDFRKKLRKDDHAYASLPSGISEGMSFATFFSGQWALLSRFLKADVIHYRDGFLGPAIYEMKGPFGNRGPKDPSEGAEWSRELITFFREARAANPDCLVMLYSSARSAVGEYHVGCFDLEKLVASEAIDVWIDQSWAGAWQDWWTHEFRGWTFQLANLIAHHIMVCAGNARRKKPCRHYHLLETWDAWEPWDTLHQVPDKLRWGIWAFSHVVVATPGGLSRLGGTYISWAQNWENSLLSQNDVLFLETNLNQAVANANGMTEVYGPAMALNQPHMESVQKSEPHAITGDLIDDECAMLMKLGVPCLSGLGLGSTPVEREGYILQNPDHLSPEWRDHLRKPSTAYIAAGPAQHIDAGLLKDIGVEDTGENVKIGKQLLKPVALARDVLPQVASVVMPPNRHLKPGTSRVLVQTNRTVLAAQSPEGAKFLWQPQFPFVPWISYLGQSQYGSLAPFSAMARAWQRSARQAQSAWVDDMPHHLPVAFHLWRSNGSIFVLLGNLETGITGDSRSPREIRFTLSKGKLQLPALQHSLKEVDGTVSVEPVSEDADEIIFHVKIGPQGSAVFEVCSAGTKS